MICISHSCQPGKEKSSVPMPGLLPLLYDKNILMKKVEVEYEVIAVNAAPDLQEVWAALDKHLHAILCDGDCAKC